MQSVVYYFHAPETECIGKGKASAPYEFGVKVSIVTTNARAPGGQFVLHAKALPGNPCDGHTLRDVIDQTQQLTGCEIERGYVEKGYRGHDAQNPRRVFISGQKRGVFGVIKREPRRRSIEPVIGHMKAGGHLGRCYLKGRAGDAANAILSAVGQNLRRVLAWLRALLLQILIAIGSLFIIWSTLNQVCLTADYSWTRPRLGYDAFSAFSSLRYWSPLCYGISFTWTLVFLAKRFSLGL
jgi:transposase, IS5 family